MIIFIDGFCKPDGSMRTSDTVILDELKKHVSGVVGYGPIDIDGIIKPIIGATYRRAAKRQDMVKANYQPYQAEQCIKQLTSELYKPEPVGVDYWVRNNGPLNVWSFLKIVLEQLKRSYNLDFTEYTSRFEEYIKTLFISNSVLILVPCLWSELVIHDQERWRWMFDKANECESKGYNVVNFPKTANADQLEVQLREYIKGRFGTNG
jgi:hypothetical protein